MFVDLLGKSTKGVICVLGVGGNDGWFGGRVGEEDGDEMGGELGEGGTNGLVMVEDSCDGATYDILVRWLVDYGV